MEDNYVMQTYGYCACMCTTTIVVFVLSATALQSLSLHFILLNSFNMQRRDVKHLSLFSHELVAIE